MHPWDKTEEDKQTDNIFKLVNNLRNALQKRIESCDCRDQYGSPGTCQQCIKDSKLL